MSSILSRTQGKEGLRRLPAMGENATVAVTLPPSAFRKPAAFSSSLRFLGILKQPDSDLSSADPDSARPHPFDGDLDEGDVIWSSSAYDSSPAAAVDDDGHRFVPNSLQDARSPSGQLRRPFVSERCGLSALLADDRLPLVQQSRPAVKARTALPVAVPVAGRTAEAPKAKGAAAASRGIRYQSAPVNVQAWPKWKKGPKGGTLDELADRDDEEPAEGTGRIVPPHVMVARCQTTTFSVFEGVGRTLKGRDLRRVRNAVLQKTGFLDL